MASRYTSQALATGPAQNVAESVFAGDISFSATAGGLLLYQRHLYSQHRASRDAVLQGQAFKEFHSDERMFILLADIVDRADVGVIQCGSSLGLSLKAREGLGIVANFIGQKFKRYETVQACVLSFVHHPHTTAAQLLNDFIMRDGLTDHWRRSLRR